MFAVPKSVGIVTRIPVFDKPLTTASKPIRKITTKTYKPSTQCYNGHTYTEDTTYYLYGKKRCKTCNDSGLYKRNDSYTRGRVYILKTHCINNHPLTEDNLYYPKSGRRKRECKACIKMRLAKYKTIKVVKDTYYAN